MFFYWIAAKGAANDLSKCSILRCNTSSGMMQRQVL
uniref:Uncharacterized protein n=1 Tax=Rhizophora mucronata TaxID=61149 RepID=A0A2P2Q706_RHIMU